MGLINGSRLLAKFIAGLDGCSVSGLLSAAAFSVASCGGFCCRGTIAFAGFSVGFTAVPLPAAPLARRLGADLPGAFGPAFETAFRPGLDAGILVKLARCAPFLFAADLAAMPAGAPGFGVALAALAFPAGIFVVAEAAGLVAAGLAAVLRASFLLPDFDAETAAGGVFGADAAAALATG